jgi:hypothetical protein
MKFKRFVYVGLVLGGSWFGCYIAWRQYVQSFARRLHPPSAEQVRKWAGLSESGHLIMTTLTNVPSDSDVGFLYDNHFFGKFTSLWAYENCKQSSTNSVVIAVYTPGALLTTNRTTFIDALERINTKLKRELSAHPPPIGQNPGQDLEELQRICAQVTMPDGEISYGFLEGLSPARFAFHPKFDVLMYEYIEPESYDIRYPPAEKVDEVGGQQLYELFTNVNAFLTSQ